MRSKGPSPHAVSFGLQAPTAQALADALKNDHALCCDIHIKHKIAACRNRRLPASGQNLFCVCVPLRCAPRVDIQTRQQQQHQQPGETAGYLLLPALLPGCDNSARCSLMACSSLPSLLA